MHITKLFGHILLCLVICSVYFAYRYVKYSDVTEFVDIWLKFKQRTLQKLEKNETAALFSSVYCRGNNHTDRFCRFQNLCYDPSSELFLFFHSEKSIITGLPLDRFAPTLVDFSSVSDHNTLFFNYVELPSTTTSRFNISRVRGHALMFKRFNPDNLMHVFHDDLLPAFVTVKEIPSDDVFLVFADNRPPGPYADLYEGFLVRKPLYVTSLTDHLIHCFENAYVGLNKHSTWYQYGFKVPQGPLSKNLNEVAPLILNFRDYFIKRFLLDRASDNKTALLLVRKHNRKILNEIEIADTVSDVTGLETKLIGLEDRSVLDVIQEVINSRLLIGVHGSLLILSLFLSPFSIVLELFPYGINPTIGSPYRTLAEIPHLRLSYQSWWNMHSTNSVPHPEYSKELGGLQHLSMEERQKIQNSVVEPFLCCDDPVWLYRIYQDSLVDVPSFEAALKEVLESHQRLFSSPDTMKGYILYPSEVVNITCAVDRGDKVTLAFSWDEPWNLRFMNATLVEYEVWIQDMATNDVQAFLMTKKAFKYFVKSETDVCYTWIRCYADGRIGPFNSNPFVCAWS